jgi:acyl-CoA synthetase (AMP-forming)/AMP-acid ligase II
VKEAAVIAVPDDLLGNRLHAFVVGNGAASLTEKDILVHCGQLLPRYMMPERIEFRSELPKTSTGKIDRPLLAREGK